MIDHDDNSASHRFRLLDPNPSADRWQEESEETFDQASPAQPPADASVEESDETFDAVASAPLCSYRHVEASAQTFAPTATEPSRAGGDLRVDPGRGDRATAR